MIRQYYNVHLDTSIRAVPVSTCYIPIHVRFSKHVDGSAVLPSDLKSAVFSMAMASGDETTFDQLVKVCVCCVVDSFEIQV